MKFYFDENITPQIARALAILQEPLPEIKEVAKREKKPFAFVIRPGSKKMEKL